MDIVLLLACTAAILTLCVVVIHLPGLGQLLMPSTWLLVVVGVSLATWFLHE